MEFKAGATAVVLNNGEIGGEHDVRHYIQVGAEVVVVDVDLDDEGPGWIFIQGPGEFDGDIIDQIVRPQSLQLIGDVSPLIGDEGVEAFYEDRKLPEPRAKVVYSVEDGKFEYILTRDRQLARDIKAELGGKAAGVKIIRYVATHEIR